VSDQHEIAPDAGAGTAAPGTPRRRQYRRSGAYAVRQAISAKGLAGIDTELARELGTVRDAYAADLGGELTTGQATLLEALLGQLAILRAIDTALGERPDWIVNRRRRELSRLAKDRAGVAGRVKDICAALGLERRAREVPTLTEYLRIRSAALPGAAVPQLSAALTPPALDAALPAPMAAEDA
jgi:hypothetical protein